MQEIVFLLVLFYGVVWHDRLLECSGSLRLLAGGVGIDGQLQEVRHAFHCPSGAWNARQGAVGFILFALGQVYPNCSCCLSPGDNAVTAGTSSPPVADLSVARHRGQPHQHNGRDKHCIVCFAVLVSFAGNGPIDPSVGLGWLIRCVQVSTPHGGGAPRPAGSLIAFDQIFRLCLHWRPTAVKGGFGLKKYFASLFITRVHHIVVVDLSQQQKKQ